MNNRPTRLCPICGGSPGSLRFPYRTRYDDIDFDYLGCRACATVFVDPVPAPSTFAKMYAKSAYHDVHYGNPDSSGYRKSAELLAKHVPAGSVVLDYGCGAGGFLAACSEQAFRPIGVDFDESAARSAAEFVGCAWASMADFEAGQPESLFDVIHLGDVLEHLPDPHQTIVEETGWPYRGIGKVKDAIASTAVALGGRRWLGLEFGNRFKGIFFVTRESTLKDEA